MARKVTGLRAKNAQDERITQEIERLNNILKNIHESKRSIAKGLIENIAFMSVTLEDLQEVIKRQGPVVMFEQGSQKMIVENPAQKSYNTMVNRYNTATKTLFDLLPKDLVDLIPVVQKETETAKDNLQVFHDKYKS